MQVDDGDVGIGARTRARQPVSAVPAMPVTFQPSLVSTSRRKIRSAPWSSTIATRRPAVVIGAVIPASSAAAAAAATADVSGPCSAEDAADPDGLVDRAARDRRGARERVPQAVRAELAHGEAQLEDALAVDLGLAEGAELLALLALGDRRPSPAAAPRRSRRTRRGPGSSARAGRGTCASSRSNGATSLMCHRRAPRRCSSRRTGRGRPSCTARAREVPDS